MMTKRAFILRIVSIVMVIALAVVIIVSLSRPQGSEKPIEEISGRLIPLFENEYAQLSPERMFKKHYGFNTRDYEGVVLYSPISNMDAQELLLVKLSEENQAQSLLSAVEERLSSQKNIYEGYAPAQYALCENAVIDLKGNYLLFVVHENADQIDEAFQKALRD